MNKEARKYTILIFTENNEKYLKIINEQIEELYQVAKKMYNTEYFDKIVHATTQIEHQVDNLIAKNQAIKDHTNELIKKRKKNKKI